MHTTAHRAIPRAVCPFDTFPNLNDHRPQIVALWYDEQRLRVDYGRAQEDVARLEKEVKRLHDALASKGKGKKNRSERRGRTGMTDKDKKGNKQGTPADDGKKSPGHGPTEQPHLEKETQVFELDEADKVCTACGGQLEEWEGQEDTSEIIEVIERRIIHNTVRQKKYRCRCGACIETAPGPEKLIPGGRYGLSLAVEAAYDKYMLHSPLERQAREMTRQGLVIESQTLWDQTYALGQILKPVYEATHAYVLSFEWVSADETTWWMMRHRHSPPMQKVGEWYIWVAHRHDAAFYLLKPTRDDTSARELLSLPVVDSRGEPALDDEGKPKRTPYAGKVVCDGWWAYKTIANSVPGVVLVHCWAHARREILACETAFPQQTKELIALIGELYAIEREAPRGPEGEVERAKLRLQRSSEVLERIVGWVFQNGLTVPPESNLRKAIGYMINHWTGLTRFVHDASLPLDNNGVERDCRQPVQGKKNHYGSRSERGAETASILYTVVQTAMLSGVEPKTYLRFAALRALRGQSVILPAHVTADDLRDVLGLSEAEVERALARRRPGAKGPSEVGSSDPSGVSSDNDPTARSP